MTGQAVSGSSSGVCNGVSWGNSLNQIISYILGGMVGIVFNFVYPVCLGRYGACPAAERDGQGLLCVKREREEKLGTYSR